MTHEECKVLNSLPDWVKESAIEFSISKPSRGAWRIYRLMLADGRTFNASSIGELLNQLDNI